MKSKYDWKNYTYSNYDYTLCVELKEDGLWEVELHRYPDEDKYDLSIIGSDKNKLIKIIRTKIHDFIHTNRAHLLSKDYSISYQFPQLLKGISEGFLYHVGKTNNQESILHNGLIPCMDTDDEVTSASVFIDYHCPKDINNIYRSRSVFLYPDFYNGNFTQDSSRKNHDLWVIDLKDLDITKTRVGSQGIGGFCMGLPYMKEEFPDNYNKERKEIISMAKKYWKNSCTIDDYINETERFKKIDKMWGMDEVIYSTVIPKVNLIGSWDDNNVFKPTSLFETYVKDMYKLIYLIHLNIYKKMW